MSNGDLEVKQYWSRFKNCYCEICYRKRQPKNLEVIDVTNSFTDSKKSCQCKVGTGCSANKQDIFGAKGRYDIIFSKPESRLQKWFDKDAITKDLFDKSLKVLSYLTEYQDQLFFGNANTHEIDIRWNYQNRTFINCKITDKMIYIAYAPKMFFSETIESNNIDDIMRFILKIKPSIKLHYFKPLDSLF